MYENRTSQPAPWGSTLQGGAKLALHGPARGQATQVSLLSRNVRNSAVFCAYRAPTLAEKLATFVEHRLELEAEQAAAAAAQEQEEQQHYYMEEEQEQPRQVRTQT